MWQRAKESGVLHSERGAKSEPATASLERCGEVNRGVRQSCAGVQRGE